MARSGIPAKTRFEVFKRDHFTCVYCGVRASTRDRLEIDHVRPYSRGGAHNITNFVTACQRCNAGKGDRPIRALPVRLESCCFVCGTTEGRGGHLYFSSDIYPRQLWICQPCAAHKARMLLATIEAGDE